MVKRKLNSLTQYINKYDKFLAVSKYLQGLQDQFDDTQDEEELKDGLEFLLGVLKDGN